MTLNLFYLQTFVLRFECVAPYIDCSHENVAIDESQQKLIKNYLPLFQFLKMKKHSFAYRFLLA